jgi:hypothetical protein
MKKFREVSISEKFQGPEEWKDIKFAIGEYLGSN